MSGSKSALKAWKKDMFWACSKGELERVKSLTKKDPRCPDPDVNKVLSSLLLAP